MSTIVFCLQDNAHGRIVYTVYTCATGCCLRPAPLGGPEVVDEAIPHVYSKKEAEDLGWHYTRSRYYVDPEKHLTGAWVCPKCWEGEK